jgi:DNA-binding transcriptional ArsR family regulator
MKEEVKIFKAIGDETRIKILLLLANKNICAKGIARFLGISEAAVSQHIKILKDVELIIGYKRGYHVVYDLNKEVLKKSMTFMSLLINEDISSINIEGNEFDNLQCKNSCKSMKICCKRISREEE